MTKSEIIMQNLKVTDSAATFCIYFLILFWWFGGSLLCTLLTCWLGLNCECLCTQLSDGGVMELLLLFFLFTLSHSSSLSFLSIILPG